MKIATRMVEYESRVVKSNPAGVEIYEKQKMLLCIMRLLKL